MAKRITIGSRAVAVGIVREVLNQAHSAAWHKGLTWDAIEIAAGNGEFDPIAEKLADALVGIAWDVQYKPTAERLVVVFDAGVTDGDAMRSTPEDQTYDGESDSGLCPYISNGHRCKLRDAHTGDHVTSA